MQLTVTTVLKQTTSLCPICKAQIAAEVYESDGRVYLRKACAAHGAFDVLINSDRRFYYESTGAGGACQCSPGHSDLMAETAATCIALIEIVESCNMKCPTCYAGSPFAESEQFKSLALEEFWSRVNSVIARKGPIDVLQLSGGEPTIHPQFFELLESVLRDPRIHYTLLNTNGLLIARDNEFADRLGQLHRAHRKFELYLQYDGPQREGQLELRAGDFRQVRHRAIERCTNLGIPVSLGMTVTPANIGHLGESVRVALEHHHIRGITFQPMFHSGRTHTQRAAGFGPRGPEFTMNVADVIVNVIEQSEGLLSAKDFTPLPCGDPNCHTIGYILRRDGQNVPVSRVMDLSNVQGFLKDRLDFNMEDLSKCGCESEPLGEILKALEIGPDNVFRIFIKPFMDAWTYDQDRIDRCCVHVIGEEGKLESFCRHYAMRS